MKKFKMWGQAVFFAENIDDACKKLSEYFANAMDADTDIMEGETDIHIRPVEDANEEGIRQGS